MLIGMEGIDGLGKTTLIEEVKKRMPTLIVTKEPGSPHLAVNQAIRKIVLESPGLLPLSRELLFYADCNEHKSWLESQQQDVPILSDRAVWSHFAYLQGYRGLGLIGTRLGSLLQQIIPLVCPEPSAMIYLNGSLKLMRERLKGKKADLIEQMGDSFFIYVLAKYSELLRAWQKPLLILDPMHSIDDNCSLVLSFLGKVIENDRINKEKINGADQLESSEIKLFDREESSLVADDSQISGSEAQHDDPLLRGSGAA